MKHGVILLAGPTASGKSAVAISLAEKIAELSDDGCVGGVIINADSMQVYRDLEIITARPGETAEKRVPHRLYGILDGGERCSAGRWLLMVGREIEAALAAKQIPIVVGGTGLYFKALLEGLAPVPDIPPDVHADLQRQLAAQGADAFHARLKADDPAAADRFPASDIQRMLRAAGVLAATGRTLSDWQSDPPSGGLELPYAPVVLTPDRETVYERCDGRFDAMIDAGAVTEVQNLLARQLDPELPVMKAVGVPELAAHLAGEMDLAAAVLAAKQSSRRYAKRQFTWIRNQMQNWNSYTEQDSERLLPKIFSFVRQFLLTPNR